MKIVTKEYLIKELGTRPAYIIGRALVALFRYQTDEERYANRTKNNNGVGFTQADARIGCLGAKYFLKHGTMEDWQIKNWLLPNKKCKPIESHRRTKIIKVTWKPYY